DVCHYCTFAKTPRHLDSPYMSLEQVLQMARKGAELGCREALFTLGEKPERRYRAARQWLVERGYTSTIDYLRTAATAVLEETSLLPHLNPGNMSPTEMDSLRSAAPSMGIMLESASDRLTQRGMPHYGSPDKVPSIRLETMRNAGEKRIPLTTGILIGIGETRRERVESLLAIRDLHQSYGHIQEVIVQNFRAKPGTQMASFPEPDLNELLWTIAMSRIVFGGEMSIQAPPNLSPGALSQIVASGINDWGGVSPVTPDFVNPEAPWPHLEQLRRETEAAGKHLGERLTIYPNYIANLEKWVDPCMHTRILRQIDASGLPRTDSWSPGTMSPPPDNVLAWIGKACTTISPAIRDAIARVRDGRRLQEQDVTRLLSAQGEDLSAVVNSANDLRRKVNGDVVTFVVNRNINYTNICYFKCQFCAFSKGKLAENLRGRPYDLGPEEIDRRAREAWDRGATEVCMQGGIHPSYTGQTYLEIVQTVKNAVPDMHVHAFSPLEVWQGAATSNLSLEDYLQRLKQAGLSTLPGTAAEVLDDDIRAVLCPDKINTSQWLEVMETAHGIGLRSTATMMFGHVEQPVHWARHLLRVRDLQSRTGGFTEFVPLPFVHMEAPIYLKGRARPGPTFRESMLVYAVSRLVLHPLITNIQASWVKLGHEGLVAALNAGCNDVGGTLMNESITRAAGTEHGQETSPEELRRIIRSAGRIPRQRTTVYRDVDIASERRSRNAAPLRPLASTPARTRREIRSHALVRNERSTKQGVDA
ncbi:MAG: 5-amino-6-(D-ribitylamino)uracil--L-tyrosine 4-hydroxyphenyl transferase CofH, partial [Pseudomonadales bacterium]|nr:5-amino-6-(D-ribitylamino)uracil--L-tyrosine 4-hydroxyphenyl transferase CofH [Pseudomonadales bacterium]